MSWSFPSGTEIRRSLGVGAGRERRVGGECGTVRILLPVGHALAVDVVRTSEHRADHSFAEGGGDVEEEVVVVDRARTAERAAGRRVVEERGTDGLRVRVGERGQYVAELVAG